MSEFERRKRNIDFNRLRNRATGINWGEQDELEEDYEFVSYDEEEHVNHIMDHSKSKNEGEEQLYLNGKPFLIRDKRNKKKSFEDTHVRITTYLERDIQSIIKIMQKNGQIKSITDFINESIKENLLNNYQEN